MTHPTSALPAPHARATPSPPLDPLAGDLNPVRADQLLRRSYPDHASGKASVRAVAIAWAGLKADLERGGYRHPVILAGILTPSYASATGGSQEAVLMWGATSPAGDPLNEQVDAVTVRLSGSKTVILSLDGATDTP